METTGCACPRCETALRPGLAKGYGGGGVGAVALGLWKHDAELVPPEARGPVHVAYGGEDDLGDLLQDGRADLMPVAVVDQLEVVEVQHDEAELAVVAVGAGDLLIEP